MGQGEGAAYWGDEGNGDLAGVPAVCGAGGEGAGADGGISALEMEVNVPLAVSFLKGAPQQSLVTCLAGVAALSKTPGSNTSHHLPTMCSCRIISSAACPESIVWSFHCDFICPKSARWPSNVF